MTKHNLPYSNIPPRTAGVYVLTCTATGAKYVGSSNNVRRRAKEHFNDAARSTHSNHRIQSLYNAHGASAFKIEILLEVSDRDERISLEQREIDTGLYRLNINLSARPCGRKGRQNSFHIGHYVTPLGVYESRDLAAKAFSREIRLDASTISGYCRKSSKTISTVAYGKSQYLRTTYSREIIGKTFHDIGFGFIPKG